MIKMTNEFHNTTARVVVTPVKNDEGKVWLSMTAYKRAMKKLCGMKDCSCGNSRAGQPIFEDKAGVVLITYKAYQGGIVLMTKDPEDKITL